jgi:hypothetical protein
VSNARRSAQRLKPFVEFSPEPRGYIGAVLGDIEKDLPQIVPGVWRKNEKPLHSLVERLGPASFFDHLAKFIENLIAIEQVAPLGLASASFQSCFELMKGLFTLLLVTFKEPQRLSHDLTRGLVTAGLHTVLKERIQFRGDRNVHGGSVRSHI